MSEVVTFTWAGSPSRIATREGPWDSPAVSQRSMASVFHGRYGVLGRSPGREMPGDEDAGESPQQQERAERQRLAQRGPLAPADRPGEAHEREEHEPAVEAEQPRRDAEEAQREPEERREPDVAVPEPDGPDPPQRVRRQERWYAEPGQPAAQCREQPDHGVRAHLAGCRAASSAVPASRIATSGAATPVNISNCSTAWCTSRSSPE